MHAPRADLDLQKATKQVREMSAAFRQSPWIQTSRTQLVMFNRQERYLNSEGSSANPSAAEDCGFRVFASAQALDGLPLSDASPLTEIH